MHLKNLAVEQLQQVAYWILIAPRAILIHYSLQVAKELRADLIYNVSQTGGHLGSRYVLMIVTSLVKCRASFFREHQ